MSLGTYQHVKGIQYRCPCCCREFETVPELREHLYGLHPWALSVDRTTKPSPDAPQAAPPARLPKAGESYCCSVCGLVTVTVDAMAIHVRAVHPWAKLLASRYPPPPPAPPTWRISTVCSRCADPIIGRSRGAKFCSRRCRIDAADDAWRARRHAAGAANMARLDATEYVATCVQCQAAPTVDGLGRFCSAACRSAYGWAARRAAADGSRPCASCGESFAPSWSGMLTCSKSCWDRHRRRERQADLIARENRP